MRWTIAQLLLVTCLAALALAAGRYCAPAVYPVLHVSLGSLSGPSTIAMLCGGAWVALATGVSFYLWPRDLIPWLVLLGGAAGATLGTPATHACYRSWSTYVVEWSCSACLCATLGMGLLVGTLTLLRAVGEAIVNFDW